MNGLPSPLVLSMTFRRIGVVAKYMPHPRLRRGSIVRPVHPIVVGRRLRWPLTAFVALTVVCRPYIAPSLAPSAFPFRVDSLRTEIVRAGVVHRFIYAGVGPWAIHTLEVDRARCWSARAVKAGGGALGVDKTSALVGQLAARRTKVAGGVNADGLVPTGSGLPAGAH